MEKVGQSDFVFVPHHPTLFLTGNKLNYFSSSQVCFVDDSNWEVISPSLS